VKVLLSAFQCSPGMGSEPGNGWQWSKALADAGHEVTVLTQPEFRERISAEGRGDINFQFVKQSMTPFGNVKLMRVYDNYRRWQNAAIDHAEGMHQDFDVIHHVVWGSLHLGSRLWRLPTPMVYGPIGGGQTAPANYWRYFGRGWPTESLRNLATGRLLELNAWSRETLQHAAVTLVTNSATEAAARRLGARDIRYFLAEGLPADWIAPPRRRPSGTPIVFWVGRFLPRKAPMLAIEAFSELRKTMQARLIMAGDGPLLADCREAVSRLGLGSDAELPGRVPWSQVMELCDGASVFLFTSLRDSSGAQFLEAMGRGLPAVALDHHGIGDLKVGLAAEKVEIPRRPEELHGRIAASLRTILTGDDWEARSAAATSWASGHVWPAKAAAATQIYKEVVSGRWNEGR
jgi:glycosyltransferase involved in cell wall biosynthesis